MIPDSLVRLFLIAGVLFTGFPSSLESQAAKDPSAVHTVQTAIDSTGGSYAFDAIQDATLHARVQGNSETGPSSIIWRSIGMSLRTDTSTSGVTVTSAVQNR